MDDPPLDNSEVALLVRHARDAHQSAGGITPGVTNSIDSLQAGLEMLERNVNLVRVSLEICSIINADFNSNTNTSDSPGRDANAVIWVI